MSGSAGPRLFVLLLGAIAVAAVMFLLVLPGRAYLAQQHSMAAAQTRLQVLSNENATLSQAAQQLQTDAEIERLARQQYGLVKQGEQAYAIAPAQPPAARGPGQKPARPGIVSRLWRDAQFWR